MQKSVALPQVPTFIQEIREKEESEILYSFIPFWVFLTRG